MPLFRRAIATLALAVVLMTAAFGVLVPTTLAQVQVIEPTLSIPIPNLKFSDAEVIDAASGNAEGLGISWIADYVQAVYDYAIAIAGVLAATMMMIGGFQYLTAGGDGGKVSGAKKRIGDALVGLILALGTYVILTTVSDRLVALQRIDVEMVERQMFAVTDLHDAGAIAPDTGGGAAAKGSPVCTNTETCTPICNLPRSQWPKTGGNVLPVEQTVIIGRLPGISSGHSLRVAPEMQTALERAGRIAQQRGYTINIGSAYRPLENQIAAACEKIKQGLGDQIGSIVARPGTSNHGHGKAVDVVLMRDGKKVTTSASSQQYDEVWRDHAMVLAEIMAEAGLVRYSREIWHFEIPTGEACRCKGAACAFPPPKAPSC